VIGELLISAEKQQFATHTLLALSRQPRIPRWLGARGLIAFAEQALETITIFGSTGFTQPWAR
jgi:hypothetical protein